MVGALPLPDAAHAPYRGSPPWVGELGRLPDAVDVLAEVVTDQSNCRAGADVISVLVEVVDRLDEYESEVDDFAAFARSCERLARYYLNCADEKWKQQSELIWAEFTIVGACGNEAKLAAAENILDKLQNQGWPEKIDWLRCKGRLAEVKGQFEKGLELWGKIRRMTKPTDRTTNRPWRWWQGKYHELKCFAQLPSTTKTQLDHAIEVLETSFDVPEFWAEKLKLLMTKC